MISKIPLGWRRLLLLFSAVWIAGFSVVFRDDLAFSLDAAGSTPSTMCEDMYNSGTATLRECQYAAPGGWAENFTRIHRGEKTPFDYYQAEHHRPTLWLWLFGMPVLSYLFALAILWIREGFQSDASNGHNNK